MIDCTKTTNYFNEKLRMTKRHKLKNGGYACKLDCSDCPLSHSNNGLGVFCSNFETVYPEKAIEIVQRWSDENPQRTYLSVLLEHYPNVQLHVTGILTGIPRDICPYQLGLMSIDDCPKKDRNCVKCWNQPMPAEGGEE